MNRALAPSAFLLSFAPGLALANTGGVGGYTGKPINGKAGESCNQCHGGGTATDGEHDGPGVAERG